MFQLHDRTRRRMCLAAFVLLGVLPALLAGGWCLESDLPGCAETEAEQLSRELGLDVKLGGLKYLRPGATLYENLEISDPETGKPIFRCRALEEVAATADRPTGPTAGRRALERFTAPGGSRLAPSSLAVSRTHARRLSGAVGRRSAVLGNRAYLVRGRGVANVDRAWRG